MAQAMFLGKLLVLPFMLIDDLLRVFSWLASLFRQEEITQKNGISRLAFLSRMGLIVGSLTFGSFIYGFARGGYALSKKRIVLKFKNLPDGLRGLKIVQVSDMHLGSFADTSQMATVVEQIQAEEPDLIFFTGDLVNYAAKEAQPYKEHLGKLKAKHGTYSILGNHDYGTYIQWETQEAMQQNLQALKDLQTESGWRLLLDEHDILEIKGSKLAIIGIQYWGHSMRFGKVGNLQKAASGAETADLRLLLSHDPSHWDYEVTVGESYKNIDATFSGHTHGFQFGVEIPSLGLKWSPAKYVYPYWAGLYEKNGQQLYVNRGIGFIGYPGRLGIPPEITVFQLEQA
jgi:predicted MPP superfamily phosphohydrolase